MIYKAFSFSDKDDSANPQEEEKVMLVETPKNAGSSAIDFSESSSGKPKLLPFPQSEKSSNPFLKNPTIQSFCSVQPIKSNKEFHLSSSHSSGKRIHSFAQRMLLENIREARRKSSNSSSTPMSCQSHLATLSIINSQISLNKTAGRKIEKKQNSGICGGFSCSCSTQQNFYQILFSQDDSIV
eukprot:TRINITY_DN52495_c0_g1_i2.p1 TRINITY_DN52495_c0_g1~~TRINITY_DN52495_c0_g1_i2.p1  ORF type:complete len:183 (-),score=8.80 TRINITY_DN52495_c0_g1_i2:54-602(-)